MARQDPNRILRLMPTIVGILGSTLLVLNRLLLTEDLTGSQSRSDALGVILSALLVLTGLLWQRVQPRTPDAVTLIGEQGFEIDSTLPEFLQTELAWTSYSLLTNTPTQSMAIWYDGKTLLRRGVLGVDSKVTPGAIVERSLQTEQPVYLVSLKLYPGRVEFTYLPENTQAVICQPLGKKGVMVLGANAPRSYTQDHEAWVGAIADKLTKTLSLMLE
jgi:Cofactor assembly of complex C subunit B, CCB2/CCB4